MAAEYPTFKRETSGTVWLNQDASNTMSTRQTSRKGAYGNYNTKTANWGAGASRGIYSTYTNFTDTDARARDLLSSRLWKGVPQLSEDMLNAFEAAYTGHQFFFVIEMPRFMYSGIYANTNMHQQAKNIKAIIERASVGFNGFSNMTMEFSDQDDGNGRKISHPTRVTKEQTDITLRLHEFAGLPLKNAIETWMTGVYDYRSEHGHYHGNLGIPGGWCNANHTMSLLVVQVDPSWTEIQDAAYYYNMMPTEVPFDHFNWTKGEHTIVEDYDLTFKCNEERSPAIMYAAEKYMNARILSMVQTSAYNSRQFVACRFADGTSSVGTLANVASQRKSEVDAIGYNYNLTFTERANGQTSNVEVTNALTGTWAEDPNTVTQTYKDKTEPDDTSALVTSK